MGKNVRRMLKFAIDYPGWHSYGKDQSTIRALRSLERMGFVEVNEYRQFRLMIPAYERESQKNS